MGEKIHTREQLYYPFCRTKQKTGFLLNGERVGSVNLQRDQRCVCYKVTDAARK